MEERSLKDGKKERRANTMTMKEKLKIHREMEKKNRERIKEYIAQQKKRA